MLSRFLSMLVAVAVLVAPCAIVDADHAFAAGGDGAPAASSGHVHGMPAQAPHCPGAPGEVVKDCATDCHSWHVSAAPGLTSSSAKAGKPGPDPLPAMAVMETADAAAGVQAPLVPARFTGAVARAPVYALTGRYRL